MEQAYLNNIRKEIILKLKEAKYNISIAMAWFTNIELLNTLKETLKRNVKVQLIILDDEINRNDLFGLDFNEFIDLGGELYLFDPNEKLMHNKFCIIDSSIVITGSYNWTNYAEHRNLENIIITDQKSIIQSYQDGFDAIIKIAKKSKEYYRIPAPDISKETYLGNYNEYLFEYKLFQNSIPIINNEPKVISVTNRQNPRSKYNIGFRAYINNDNNGMRLLIPKGTELPYSIIKDAWLNKDNVSTIPCEIYYGNIEDSINNNNKLITLELKIPSTKKNELHFKIKTTMDTNGYLHIEFVCTETGKAEESTLYKKELVNY